MISDTANTANSQTCAYGYDDLTRLKSATCNSTPAWSQTFSYDVFGNINKSGNVSFSSQGGTGNHAPGLTYDANGTGNVVADNLGNSYTYDAEGRPVDGSNGVTSNSTIYDAFNRAVEIKVGSSYTQVVYAPDGYKFALMNGQTVQKYFAPLAAGLQAVYTANTPAAPAYWRHSDWLGSSRLASTASQTVYHDGAYAPFGETYVETGTADRSFTGQTQDVIAGSTGIYDFMFRQQASSQGRWLVPDPAGLAAVDLTNPQTWNRYAYVANSPTGTIDPSGLCGEITAGIGQGPDTLAGKELIQIVQLFCANVVFPYAGQSKFSSILGIAFQGLGANKGATAVASQALLATQADARANGTAFLAAGFSGGSQANVSATAQNGLTPEVSIFVDPGLGIGASLPGNSTVYRTSGLTSGLINLTSPGGNTVSVPDCNHDINCVIAANPGLQEALIKAGPCSTPTIYSRGSAPTPITSGTGGGGWGGGGGGWGYGSWVWFPSGPLPGENAGWDTGFWIGFGAPLPGGPRFIK